MALRFSPSTRRVDDDGGFARRLGIRARALGPAAAAGDDQARILGPIPAWVPRRAGRWRENLILRAASIEPYLPLIRGRDLTVDVDPETLL